MQPHRELIYPVRLSQAQLFALLTMVQAPTLIGANLEHLMSLDEAAKKPIWDQGVAELRQDGWMIRDEAAETDDINQQLLMLIINAVGSRVTVVSSWEQHDGIRRGVTHYDHEDMVIEMSMFETHYEFLALATRQMMLQRLANDIAVPIPNGLPPRMRFVLTQPQAEQAKQNPDPRLLEQFGLESEVAHAFASSLQAALLYGTITIFRNEVDEIIASRVFGLLVAANGAWLVAINPERQDLTYFLVGENDFREFLDQDMSELAAIQVQYDNA